MCTLHNIRGIAFVNQIAALQLRRLISNYRVLKMLRRSTIAGVIAVCPLAGCAVGPDFHSPAPPTTATYTRGQQPGITADAPASGGPAQTFVADRDIPAEIGRASCRERVLMPV